MVRQGTKILVAGGTLGTVLSVLPQALCSIEVQGQIMIVPIDKIALDDDDLMRHPTKSLVVFHG